MRRARLTVPAMALAGVLALSACSAASTPTTASSGTGTAASCTKDSLSLATPGKLTIATDSPAYAPWFVDNDPSNGKGFESAVAYAIADKLGFSKDEVSWVVAPFNSVIAPGRKNFDFDVNEVSITAERRTAVDFSSGYYDVRQAVVTYKGSPIDGVTTVAGLAGAKLGAQVGTTSYNAIKNVIKATQQPAVFDTNDLAVQALKNKQIDGVVVDLPTAFYMVSAQLDNGVIVGQLPQSATSPEQFGAVLDLHSPLTACVTKAVDSLRSDGTLDKLASQWLAAAGAPELK